MTDAQDPQLPAGSEAGEWTWPRRLVFRFLFCFLASIFLPLPFEAIPGTKPVGDAYRAAWGHVTPWVGQHLLGLAEPVAVGPTGSADMTHHWILLLCRLALSAAIAVSWSIFDRRRQIHPWWVDGLNVYLRYGLGYIMLLYGFGKIFPSQFLPLAYDQLVSPLGRFSPMGLLWAFMGASRGYAMFAGAAEVLGGTLLFFRRTTLLGALICGAVLTNVLALNFFYDVPVKLYSALLLATVIFLILPDARRLASLLLLNRPVPARDLTMPAGSRRFRVATRVAKAALLAVFLFASIDYNTQYLPPAEKPPLYGIYEVVAFTLDGQPLPAVQTEPERWRRVLFNARRNFTAQRMDDKVIRWTVKSVDEAAGKIVLTGWDEKDKNILDFEREGGAMILKGRFNDHDIVARLRQVEDPKFELTSREFRWISEAPYHRF